MGFRAEKENDVSFINEASLFIIDVCHYINLFSCRGRDVVYNDFGVSKTIYCYR